MPVYEYLCDSCGRTTETLQRGDTTPCECGLSARRRFGFRTQRSSFTGGFNPAVGKHIGSMGELKSEFSRISEKQSRETGVEVDIQPIDYNDRAACGITDADIDRMTEEKAKAGIPQ
jgi:putative FmdB family regulatory protein